MSAWKWQAADDLPEVFTGKSGGSVDREAELKGLREIEQRLSEGRERQL